MASTRAAANVAEHLTEIVSLLVLGAGFVALFAGVDNFFLIWILGFAVLVPIVELLTRDDEETDESSRDEGFDRRRVDDADPLAVLRDRYARGEIDDEEFERRLEALLETETPEDVRRRVERETEQNR
jgi:uncharacterized membrane protein